MFNKCKLVIWVFLVLCILILYHSQDVLASLSRPSPEPIKIIPSDGPPVTDIDTCSGLSENDCRRGDWCLWQGEKGQCVWEPFPDAKACFCIPVSRLYTPTPTPTPTPDCSGTIDDLNYTDCCVGKNPPPANCCAYNPTLDGCSTPTPTPAIDCRAFKTAQQCTNQDCIWEAQNIRRKGYCHWVFERCFCDPLICGDGYVEGDEECDCGENENGDPILDCTTNNPNCPKCKGCKCSAITMKEINQLKLCSSNIRPLCKPLKTTFKLYNSK